MRSLISIFGKHPGISIDTVSFGLEYEEALATYKVNAIASSFIITRMLTCKFYEEGTLSTMFGAIRLAVAVPVIFDGIGVDLRSRLLGVLIPLVTAPTDILYEQP